jgi:uncharacterized protein (UPF0262 family)
MPDPRLIDIQLDMETILWRNAEVEQERRIAIFDLLEDNVFAPQRQHEDGYAGPYRLTLKVHEGRLVMEIAREDGSHLETIILAMTRFRRIIREYWAICDSYYTALKHSTPERTETVDMARRALHNQAAETLIERLEGKIKLDENSARRLFTLISVLHIRN